MILEIEVYCNAARQAEQAIRDSGYLKDTLNQEATNFWTAEIDDQDEELEDAIREQLHAFGLQTDDYTITAHSYEMKRYAGYKL